MQKSNNLLKGILLGISITCLTAFVAEKTFVLKFSEAEINKHYQKLSVIRQIVDNSNLSHQEVVFVTKSIDISELANGIYYLTVNTKDAKRTYKVLKQ